MYAFLTTSVNFIFKIILQLRYFLFTCYLILLFTYYNALWVLRELKFPKFLIFILSLFVVRRSLSTDESLNAMLRKLGGAYIKLGQFLSLREDILGLKNAKTLASLQDNLKHEKFSYIKATIEESLGNKLGVFFSSFSKEPVATASVAQVHFGVLKGGQKVAVKVVRRNIRNKFKKDIRYFSWVVQHLVNFFPQLNILKLPEVLSNFDEWNKIETNLKLEGAAACELKDNFNGIAEFQQYKVPKIYWEMTTKDVLTLQRVENAFAIDDLAKIKKYNLDPNEIEEFAMRCLFHQIYNNGFFHADIHPGNVFIDKHYNVYPVDFGIMGRISDETKLFLIGSIAAFLKKDYARAVDIYYDANIFTEYKERDLLIQMFRAIGESYLNKSVKGISIGKLLREVFSMASTFHINVNMDLLLLQKNIMMAEGLARKIGSSLDIWQINRELIKNWMRKNNVKIMKAKIKARHLSAQLRQFALLPQQLETISQAMKKSSKKNHSSFIPMVILVVILVWILL